VVECPPSECEALSSNASAVKKGRGYERERLRKSNIDGVNLIGKYMHVVNIVTKSICTINLC
jgi:hypothetical protein